MGVRFGTSDWAESLRREINASSEYRNAASQWGVGFNGDVLLVFTPDAALAEPQNLLVRLEGGACLGAEFLQDAGGAAPGFVLRAPFSLWKEILDRKTLAATAILTGRMKIEGNPGILLRFLAAHRALIHCAASLDTAFS